MDTPAYHHGYFPFIEYDYFQGRAQCTVCGRLLVFTPGCALVQCSNCSSVLSLRPFGARGQSLCSGCSQMILFPLGVVGVQCSHCDTYTEIPPPSYYICKGCGLYLTYSHGPAKRVMCMVCNTLKDVREEDTEETAWEEARRAEEEATSQPGPSRSAESRQKLMSLEGGEVREEEGTPAEKDTLPEKSGAALAQTAETSPEGSDEAGTGTSTAPKEDEASASREVPEDPREGQAGAALAEPTESVELITRGLQTVVLEPEAGLSGEGEEAEEPVQRIVSSLHESSRLSDSPPT
mmetsp:Transcript_10543/g.32250  ORF Transcript_10543/g.32250 Transcript_10543/m.32250 type:complete len:293 (+) Transcript_10543:381-1259(+)